MFHALHAYAGIDGTNIPRPPHQISPPRGAYYVGRVAGITIPNRDSPTRRGDNNGSSACSNQKQRSRTRSRNSAHTYLHNRTQKHAGPRTPADMNTSMGNTARNHFR